MIEVVVQSTDAGKKVHRFIRQLLPGVPLSGVYKMLRTGRVKRNGKRVKSEDVLQTGDRVQLYMADADFKASTRAPKKYGGVSREVDVIYEDADILAVNKPAGLLVHGDAEEQKDTLVNRVQAFLYDRDVRDREAAEDRPTVFSVAPVHRLDRNTSGIVVFSKNAATASKLSDQIASHEVQKWYLAVVRGTIPPSGTIDAALRRESGNRTVVAREADERSHSALSRYTRKAAVGRTSVALVELVSGRTHQIRAHFQSIGHPLWGDVKYGGRTAAMAPQGASESEQEHQWLHAAWMVLPDGRRLFAPLPKEFRDTLKQLGYSDDQLRMIETL